MTDATKTSFETNFWIRQETESPFKVIDAFFQSDDLDNYKHLLAEVMMHLRIEEVYQPKYPGVVFAFYTSVHSLLKACYACSLKARNGRSQHHRNVIPSSIRLP